MDRTRLPLLSVCDVSSFVKRVLASSCGSYDSPDAMQTLERYAVSQWGASQMRSRLIGCASVDVLDVEMRRLRRDVVTSLAVRDIIGQSDFQEVVSTMTDLAEVTISASVRANALELAEQYGIPTAEDGTPVDFLVVGMGKLGGEELNVSSDVDLVFIYDEAGETRPMPGRDEPRKTLTNHEFFVRLAKRVIASLDAVDENGFVFRVDMRLRPFGDSGPIVVSTAMLEEYLYTEARDWERFAWLKGRVVNEAVFCSKDQFRQSIETLMRLVTPFVYRKYVDFSAINALSRIHTMIREESIRREARPHAGIDIKLGRGGIREIEFIAQTFELIRGGRNARLRERSSCAALPALATAGCLRDEDCCRLREDYVFLRNLEHALQYADDQQTHEVPKTLESQERIAMMLGMPREAMMRRLEDIREYVSGVFDGIFHTQERLSEASDWPVDWSFEAEESLKALDAKLRSLGFSNSGDLSQRIAHLMQLRSVGRKSEVRDQFVRFIKAVSEKAGQWGRLKTETVSADLVFERMLSLLEVIAGRSTYVALLNQYPNAAEKVGRLLATSRWATEFLMAHPILLDELVDTRENRLYAYSQEDWIQWRLDVQRRLQEADGDSEMELDLLREAQHGALFRLLLSDLEGKIGVEHLADQLSALADAVVQIVLELAWKSIPSRHTETPRLAVIGYGKLGGKELGYASDLDLVFIYDDSHPAALENYVKLVRRISSWLSVQTAAGILYSVDLRLRPNGESGLAAVSLDAFKTYQRSQDGARAWLWEQQALTRARWCAGDSEIGTAFEEERKAILMQVRAEARLKLEVVQMREKMRQSHAEAEGEFDIKHGVGGMIDVEFVVQTMVLAQSHTHPELTKNLGNSALLGMGAELGLLPRNVAEDAIVAYRHYRNLQRMIRLNVGEDAPVRVSSESVRGERSAVQRLWESMFQTSG